MDKARDDEEWKEPLHAKKAQGIILGKPKGTIQKSKFDKEIQKDA